MGLMSQNNKDLNKELSVVLRAIRTCYKNEVKLQIMNVSSIREFKLKVIRKSFGDYKFLFLIKIPKEYPFEPLLAEPIIASREMILQFYNYNFKYFKLKPLIDSLVGFCLKYDNDINHLKISFPHTTSYEEKEITTKECLFLNKNSKKSNNPLLIDQETNDDQNTIGNNHPIYPSDYYNDMGISMFSYINILKKITNNNKKISFSSTDRFSFSKKAYIRPEILMKSRNITRLNSKMLFSKFGYKTVNRIYNSYLKDLKYCNVKLIKKKKNIDIFKPISNRLVELDLLEEFSVEIEEGFRMCLHLSNYGLSVKQDIINNFPNLVEYSIVPTEERVFNSKIIMCESIENKFVALEEHKELIPFNSLFGFDYILFNFLLSQEKTEERKINLFPLLSVQNDDEQLSSLSVSLSSSAEDESTVFMDCHFSFCLESFYGFLHESFAYIEPGFDFVSYITENDMAIERCSISAVLLSNDLIVLKQKFLKDRIAQRLIFKSRLSRNYLENDLKGLRNQTKLLSEIISEVIQYPKTENHLFEYTLELNPRSSRHRILLDSIGLLKYKHYSSLEIIAPKDFGMSLFFIKEIFNPNGRGVVLKLHKISPKNHIYELILQENKEFSNILVINKSVWLTEIASEINFGLLKLIFSFGLMYLQKWDRKRKLKLEATTFQCSDLVIQRYNFSKEIIESLSIFSQEL